jgi:hypothetical protein
MVYAQCEDGRLRRLQVLSPEAPLLELFIGPDAVNQSCLLLHSRQQDHCLEPVVSPRPSLNIPPPTLSSGDVWDGDSGNTSYGGSTSYSKRKPVVTGPL